MHVSAVLKAITPLAGGEASATVQLLGSGNLDCFHDGYAVSHAIDRTLLVPGAQVMVEVPDPYHPGDGHVISVARVSNAGSTASVEQFGNVLVTTDASGNGSASLVFPNTFGSFVSPPAVKLFAPADALGSGSITAGSVTASGFTASVIGASPSAAIPLAWSAS